MLYYTTTFNIMWVSLLTSVASPVILHLLSWTMVSIRSMIYGWGKTLIFARAHSYTGRKSNLNRTICQCYDIPSVNCRNLLDRISDNSTVVLGNHIPALEGFTVNFTWLDHQKLHVWVVESGNQTLAMSSAKVISCCLCYTYAALIFISRIELNYHIRILTI